jgi:DNA-directed RNA polymerase subunit RPC12/RpoP
MATEGADSNFSTGLLRVCKALQNDAPKTRGKSVKVGCLTSVAGVIILAFVVYLAVSYDFDQIRRLISENGITVVVLVGLLAVILGLVLVAATVMRPTKAIVCPFCSTRHVLFKKVFSYVCGQCAKVLRTPGTEERKTLKVTCPACASQWGVVDNVSNICCHNCGIVLHIANGAITPVVDQNPCPRCAAAMGQGAYFCRSCGGLAREPEDIPDQVVGTAALHFLVLARIFSSLPRIDSDGMDMISLRACSPFGLLVRSCWFQQKALNVVASGASSERSVWKAGDLACDSMIFLKGAVDLLPAYETLVPELLREYGYCLGSLVNASVEWKTGALKFDIKVSLARLVSQHNLLLDSIGRRKKLEYVGDPEEEWVVQTNVDFRGQVTLANREDVERWVENLSKGRSDAVRIPKGALVDLPRFA